MHEASGAHVSPIRRSAPFGNFHPRLHVIRVPIHPDRMYASMPDRPRPAEVRGGPRPTGTASTNRPPTACVTPAVPRLLVGPAGGIQASKEAEISPWHGRLLVLMTRR